MIHTAELLRAEARKRKGSGQKIVLVPTMGALHEGHLSLVKLAKQYSDTVVVSIFVNPTQFGEGEDYEAYPREVEKDIAMLEKEGVALIYTPSEAEVYPAGKQVDIFADTELAKGLCGGNRPGHFDGVVTVVARLFEHSMADISIFGEKDFQQLQIIRKMTQDEAIDIEIIGAPILREETGLAMSSRNAYLNECERKVAAQLHYQLQQVANALPAQGREALDTAAEALLVAGFDAVDYIEWVDAVTLQPTDSLQKDGRLLAAARLGKTRLIDNIALKGRG